LTNDNLSLLAGNAVLYATLRFLRERTIFWNFVSAVLAVTACWVKATNGLFLLLHLAVRAPAGMRKDGGPWMRTLATALPFLLLLLQTGFNTLYHHDPFKTAWSGIILPPGSLPRAIPFGLSQPLCVIRWT